MKILMVCLGNICRSPLAEGIMQAKVPVDVIVDSAGTSGFHEGELPDARSIAVAHKYGIDITNQRSRKFAVNDFEEFDLIYAMDASNYNNIIGLAPNKKAEEKVKMIMNEVDANANQSVPDPYYGGELGFENVYRMLDEACENIASKI